jgi:acyl-CoA dehydrogenase
MNATATDFDPILRSVREFIHKEVIPREDEIEETDAIPEVLREEAAKMGLFGYALPEEYGGLDFTMLEEVRLSFELGQTAPAFRSLFGTNNGIAGQAIVNYGTDAQRQRYLPRLASGEAIASFALTEIEAGSDPSGLRTFARRDGDDYVISGAKRFITNALLAEVFVVFARTDKEAKGTRGISAFLVDAGTAGLTVGPKDKKMGQAGAWTSDVYLDDVRVPATAVIGEREGEGWTAAMKSLARGRLNIAALCVGLAQRILEETVAYARDNRQGGRPIGQFQLVQAMLSESQTELYAGRTMALDAARLFDAGEDRKLAPSCAKLFCSEMVGRVADRAVQVHGGMGYMRTVPVERFYRDARLYRIYEGTSEIQKLVIARHLMTEGTLL